MSRRARHRLVVKSILTSVVLVGSLALSTGTAQAHYTPGEPPGQNPGDPVFVGSDTPIPAVPAANDPSRSTLQSIYDADIAAGGTSYWFDRILARPFLSNSDSALMTRGRALYMYTHNPRTLGFGAGGTGANGGGG